MMKIYTEYIWIQLSLGKVAIVLQHQKDPESFFPNFHIQLDKEVAR